jgi:hypothetical protein
VADQVADQVAGLVAKGDQLRAREDEVGLCTSIAHNPLSETVYLRRYARFHA